MKKLLFITCILQIGGCTQNFKDIHVENPTKGTVVVIDSTQWTPALIQTNGDVLTVYSSGEIREILLVEEIVIMWLVICIIVLIGILLLAASIK